MSRLVLAGLLCGSIAPALLASGDARATSLANLSVSQMTDASTYIVRGTVTRVWTEEDADGQVWTRAAIAVSDVLKGPDQPAELIVDSIGGTFEDRSVDVFQAARFTETEDVLLFLDTIKGGTRLTPVSMYLGKYTIRRVNGDDRLLAQTFVVRPGVVYDGRFLPPPPEGSRVYLDDVIDTVETHLDAGWDGQAIPGISADKLVKINTPERRHR